MVPPVLAVPPIGPPHHINQVQPNPVLQQPNPNPAALINVPVQSSIIHTSQITDSSFNKDVNVIETTHQQNYPNSISLQPGHFVPPYSSPNIPSIPIQIGKIFIYSI